MAKKHRIRRFALLAAASGALLLVSAACSGGTPDGGPTSVVAAPDASDPAVLALASAAEAEGELNIDFLNSDEESQAEIAAFSAAYPSIKVTYRRLTSATSDSTRAGEINAGQATFDLVQTTSHDSFSSWVANGWLLDLTDLPAYAKLPANWQFKTSVNFYVSPMFICYNNQLISPSDAPRTWADLTDPRWKGQLAVPSPLGVSSTASGFFMLEQKYGDDYATKLAALKPELHDSSTEALQAVAAGNVGLLPLCTAPIVADLASQGAPISVVAQDFTPAFASEFGVYAQSKHPNAAKLFLNFMLSSPAANDIMINRGKVGLAYIDTNKFADINTVFEGVVPAKDYALTDWVAYSESGQTVVNQMARELGFS